MNSIKIHNQIALKRLTILTMMFFLFNNNLNCNKKQNGIRDCSNATVEKVIKLIASGKKFSEVFVPVDTIQLETNQNALIGWIKQIYKHPKGYLILDRKIARQVFLFDDYGKFIRTLGTRGEGPEEYREPIYIFVDKSGNSYILDSSLRKILKYDSEGNFLTEIGFRLLNIYPSEFFTIEAYDNQLFVFYNLHPDFPGKSKNQKVIITEYRSGNLYFKKSFGAPESMLINLFYDEGTFHITTREEIWLANVFSLDINLYTLNGKKIKAINEHLDLLPEPYINPEAFKQFRRISESLETYYSLTRLGKYIFLDDLIVGIFFSKEKAGKMKTHILFFNNCGNLISRSTINEERYPFPSEVIGSWKNKFFVFIEPQNVELLKEEVPNPMIVSYKLVD